MTAVTLYSGEGEHLADNERLPASITLEDAADIFSLANFVPEDTDFFNNGVYRGAEHLQQPLLMHLKDAERRVRFIKSNPRSRPVSVTLNVVDYWLPKKTLAEQPRKPMSFEAQYDSADAGRYAGLVKSVMLQDDLPSKFSAKRLKSLRDLMLLEVMLLHTWDETEKLSSGS